MDSTAPPKRGRYQVSWTTHSAVKRVEIIDRDTGKRTIGTDWASWDNAYKQAIVQLIKHPI